MLNDNLKKIINRAVLIRLNNGENIDDIMNSYPKLTSGEKAEILKTINQSSNRKA